MANTNDCKNYFLLRKKIKTDNLGGFWWDLVIIMPVAIYLTHTGTKGRKRLARI
jgi:EamA domain-containing membrane protein RarD